MIQLYAFRVWASYQIRKIAGCPCAGNAGNVFPGTTGQRSQHTSRHVRGVRAVMHARISNWRFPLMSAAGKTFPAFSARAQPAFVRICWEAHGYSSTWWWGQHSTNSFGGTYTPVIQTPQYIRPISQNAPLCGRNVCTFRGYPAKRALPAMITHGR